MVATTVLLGSASACDRGKSAAMADTDRGKALFASICSRCHGLDGRGGLAAIEGVKPRNFCDHEFHSSRSDADLEKVILNGKDNRMPAFAGALSQADVRAIVAYLRGFDPRK